MIYTIPSNVGESVRYKGKSDYGVGRVVAFRKHSPTSKNTKVQWANGREAWYQQAMLYLVEEERVLTRAQLEKIIAGALKDCIHQHGVIEKDSVGSASKRVISVVNNQIGLAETWKWRFREEQKKVADLESRWGAPGTSSEANKVRMKVITLCGSTRFQEAFEATNERLTMDGYVVLSAGGFRDSKGLSLSQDQKEQLDAIHRQKIDLSDGILVINVGGYIGKDTRSQIVYATENGKFVEYLEPWESISD